MDENTKEKDTIKVIYCKGFKKMFNINACSKEKCRYFFERKQDKIKQGEEIIRVNDRILCGYPKWEPVIQVCEVKE